MEHQHTPTLYNLYIYTNEECNLACKHCWVTAKCRNEVKNPGATLEDYINIIDQAIPLGLGYIKISGGEALLRKDVVLGIAEYAFEKKIATRVETNGTLIDEETAQTLRRTRTPVSVSLDGSNAQLHEEMRLVPGCFEDSVNGLKLLAKYKIPVEIVCSVYKKNEENIDDLVRLIVDLQLPHARLKLNPVIASGRGRIMERRGERLDAQELLRFIKLLEKKYATSTIPVNICAEPAFHSLPYIAQDRVVGGRCGFKSLLGILANGSISYCGMGYQYSKYIFGKVGSMNLADVWRNNPTLKEVREQIPSQLEGICGNCVMKKTCEGACRSHAYDVYGSITAPSPGCQELYEAGLFPIGRIIEPEKSSTYHH